VAAEEQALLRRLLDVELARDLEVSERVDSYEWGQAFLSPTLDRVWDANCIVIERAGMTADELIEAADEAIGSRGMRHRTVVVLHAVEGRRLEPELESRGWESEPGVYMEWRQQPDRESTIDVAERRQEEIEELRRRIISAELAAMGHYGDTVVEQLLEWDRRIGAVDGDRWFVAPANDEPASACRLLARDGIGQVEDVGTLPKMREQGLARAVTLAAARASQIDGNEITYLGALANDWPRLLYAKLGFEEVGYAYDFKLKPPKTRS
jgi:ribosomal protein S18 acetylase RimI-like enzyme